MRSLDTRDRRVVADLRHELTVVSEGPSAIDRVLLPLTEVLRARVGWAYGIEEWAGAFRLRFAHSTGANAARYRTLANVLGSAQRDQDRKFGFFDPDRPEAWQRNRALDFHDLTRTGLRALPPLGGFASEMGLVFEEQLRVLVCDGPSLLALVAAYRTEPWGARERGILHALLPALKRRLILERTLGSRPLLRASLDAAMDAIAAPAFVLDRRGRILHTNAAGAVVLDSGYRDVARALRESVAAPDGSTRHRLTRIDVAGVQTHFLAVARGGDATPSLATQASKRWSLTPRQAEVLTWLTAGATNARIGAELSISDRTVENHVAAIMLRAQCHSRTTLVAEVLRSR